MPFGPTSAQQSFVENQPKGESRKMNSLSSRLILVSTIGALFLVPLYAHHGNQFLSKAMEINKAEVQLGETAMNKSQNTRVKDFADMIVRDHKEAMDKLKDLHEARIAGRSKTGSTTGSTTSGATNQTTRNSIDQQSGTDAPLTPEHKRVADRLASLSGANFDREFINEMVRGHREAIQLFEAQTHVHNTGGATRNQTGTTTGQQTARRKPTSGDQEYSRSDLNKDMDTVDFARDMLQTLRHHLEEAESLKRELQKR